MVDGFALIIALSNIAANSFRAANCDGVLVKGDFGAGCFRAAVSKLAASMAASADDVPGMFSLCGEIRLFVQLFPVLSWRRMLDGINSALDHYLCTNRLHHVHPMLFLTSGVL